jgi:hypothetical protein
MNSMAKPLSRKSQIMTDLTNYFLLASAHSKTWSLNKMFIFLNKFIEINPDLKLDWEINDLKSWSIFFGVSVDWELVAMTERIWLSIKKKEKLIGYIRTDMPLLILLQECRFIFAVESEMYTILVDKFDEKKFSFDLTKEPEISSNLGKSYFWNEKADIVNPNKFSIVELWWATIVAPKEIEGKSDLTSYLIRSSNLREEWSDQKVRSALNLISQHLIDAQIVWEEEDGEKWAEVRFGNESICFIRIDIPLLFTSSNHIDLIRTLSSDQINLRDEVIFVSIENFTANNISFDRKCIEKIFSEIDFRLLSDPCSVEDFVFLTMFIAL